HAERSLHPVCRRRLLHGRGRRCHRGGGGGLDGRVPARPCVACAGALGGRHQPAHVADPAGRRRPRGEPVLSGAPGGRRRILPDLRRDAWAAGASRYGPRSDRRGPGDAAMNEAEIIAARRLRPPPGEEFWVFAYGSLMWRPGFRCLESRPALLRGYHRAFCIYSVRYRGTPERPGLVLGLDRGGACRGRALRVAAEDAEAVAAYLHEREMVTGVYEPRWLPVEVEGGRIRAATYVADRRHAQYTGKLDPELTAEMILAGVGAAGSNRDYL